MHQKLLKSHTSQEGEAHFRIFFFFLAFIDEIEKQIVT